MENKNFVVKIYKENLVAEYLEVVRKILGFLFSFNEG